LWRMITRMTCRQKTVIVSPDRFPLKVRKGLQIHACSTLAQVSTIKVNVTCTGPQQSPSICGRDTSTSTFVPPQLLQNQLTLLLFPDQVPLLSLKIQVLQHLFHHQISPFLNQVVLPLVLNQVPLHLFQLQYILN